MYHFHPFGICHCMCHKKNVLYLSALLVQPAREHGIATRDLLDDSQVEGFIVGGFRYEDQASALSALKFGACLSVLDALLGEHRDGDRDRQVSEGHAKQRREFGLPIGPTPNP